MSFHFNSAEMLLSLPALASVCGLFPGLLCFFLYRLSGLKKAAAHAAGLALFGLFTALLLSAVRFPRLPALLEALRDLSSRPFPGPAAAPANVWYIFFLFLPAGFLLPLLWQQFSRPSLVLFAAALPALSLSVLGRLGLSAVPRHILLFSVSGNLLGFFIYRLLSRRFSSRMQCFQIPWNYYPLARLECLFSVCAAALLYLLAPVP